MATSQSASEWRDLTRRQRSRQVAQVSFTIALAWAVLFGLYFLIPFDDRSSGESLVRLGMGILGFVAVLLFELRRVKNASWPVLRAVQALGVAIAVFLTIFAALYLSLSEATDNSFSEALDHTGALYLTITVFSTVGFGDITPETDLARLVTSFQMLLDLVVLGAVVNLLLNAAKSTGELDG
jgi:voltage-gated potassium channel